jgi:NitT/TauT family transport system substrate-binding protein
VAINNGNKGGFSGFTPQAKALFAIVLIAVVGFAYYKNYGNPFGKKATPVAESNDKDTFTRVSESAKTEAVPPKNVEPTRLATGRMNRPLRVAINQWAGHAAGLVANGGMETANGSINQRLGLNVQYTMIDAPDQKVAALRSGKIDAMWDTVDSWAREAGEFQTSNFPARAIVQEDFSTGGDGIAVTEAIRTVEDLRGKKIGLIQYTPSHWLLLYALSQSNLSKADIADIEKNLTFVNDPAPLAAAYLSGSVDAVVTWQPFIDQCVKGRKGTHVLIDTKYASKVIGDVIVARQDVIDSYPETFALFTDGWFQGVEEAKRNPDKTNVIVGKALNLDPGEVGGMISGFTYSNWADNAWFFGLSTPPGQESHYQILFSNASMTWRSRGAIVTSANPAERAATQFISALASKYQTQTTTVAPAIVAAAKVTSNTTGFINKQVTINFETGSSQIADTYVLDSLQGTLQSFENTVVKIEGHTDSVGSAATNKRLSQARAKAVRDYFVTKYHLDPARFKTFGFGPERPVASNATDDGRSKNRRTEIRLIPNE